MKRTVKRELAFIIAILMLLSSVMILTGCNNGKGNLKAKLTAHVWEYKDISNQKMFVSLTKEFKNDGTCVFYTEYRDGSLSTDEGTWSIDGEHLLYRYDTESHTYSKGYNELNDDDLAKGLVNAGDSKWYVSDNYFVFEGYIYTVKQ